MEQKEFYVSPEVEIMEIQVEKGFSNSNSMGGENGTPGQW